MVRLCSSDQEQINFIPAHVYYWHENLNSITRANDCQYSYGGSIRDSFYGYVENMIFAVKESKKRKPYNGFIDMWAVNCMINIYEYYIECYARSRESADNNFKWCKRYYDEVYKNLEPNISAEVFSEQYNDVIRNAYMGNKLAGIIPHISVYEFLEKLKEADDDYKEHVEMAKTAIVREYSDDPNAPVIVELGEVNTPDEDVNTTLDGEGMFIK